MYVHNAYIEPESLACHICNEASEICDIEDCKEKVKDGCPAASESNNTSVIKIRPIGTRFRLHEHPGLELQIIYAISFSDYIVVRIIEEIDETCDSDDGEGLTTEDGKDNGCEC